MQKFEEWFVAIWCVLMPVTGTVLLPSVQGTIPAYMMAFASLFLVLVRFRFGEMTPALRGYVRAALLVLLAWTLSLALSQLGLVISDRTDFSDVSMIDPNDAKVLFRTSMFTQSMYLTACVLIALYFRFFFRESWMRYVFYGGYLLAGYGIYEWFYFLVFHQPGDFLVNRTFGEDEHIASWSQGIDFGPVSLLRIKSTLGEPTFFAGVVLPYLFFAMDHRKVVLTCMLLFTALFSTSTACYIALAACLVVKTVWSGRVRLRYIVILGLVGLFLAGIAVLYPDTFDSIFTSKFSGDNVSGKMRLDQSIALHDLFASFSPANWLFGVGFGYVYQSVFLELLIDTGIVGFGLFLYIMFRPIVLLPVREGSEGLKLGLLAVAILFGLSLSELFLPTTWMFLGLAYRRLAENRVSPPLHSRRPARVLHATSS